MCIKIDPHAIVCHPPSGLPDCCISWCSCGPVLVPTILSRPRSPGWLLSGTDASALRVEHTHTSLSIWFFPFESTTFSSGTDLTNPWQRTSQHSEESAVASFFFCFVVCVYLG